MYYYLKNHYINYYYNYYTFLAEKFPSISTPLLKVNTTCISLHVLHVPQNWDGTLLLLDCLLLLLEFLNYLLLLYTITPCLTDSRTKVIATVTVWWPFIDIYYTCTCMYDCTYM